MCVTADLNGEPFGRAVDVLEDRDGQAPGTPGGGRPDDHQIGRVVPRECDQGFDVFRLNLRDHGTSHHLNPELFHSNRISEVVGASSGDYQVKEIFGFKQTGIDEAGLAHGQFYATGYQPTFLERLSELGIHVPESVFKQNEGLATEQSHA